MQSTLPPSKDKTNFWHIAEFAKAPIATKFSGKWMMFTTLENLDSIWKRVHDLTIQGKLGPSAKSSTARPNPNAINKKTKVVIVYTNDYRDLSDVARIAWVLYDQKIFISGKLKYKTNDATREGKYAYKGDKTCIYSISNQTFREYNTLSKFENFFKSKYLDKSEGKSN